MRGNLVTIPFIVRMDVPKAKPASGPCTESDVRPAVRRLSSASGRESSAIAGLLNVCAKLRCALGEYLKLKDAILDQFRLLNKF